MYDVQELIKIEEKYHLLERKVDGHLYWQYVRSRVYDSIISDYTQSNMNKQVSINVIACLVTMIKRGALRKAKKKDVMVYQDPVVYNSDKMCYECNITPPVIDVLREETFLLSKTAGIYPDRRLRYPETTVVLFPLVVGKIKRMLFRFSKKENRIKEKIWKEVNWLAGVFKNEKNISLDKNMIVEEVYRTLCVRDGYYKYFEKVLNIVKPKVIIEQCYYNLDKMVLNEVAKQMGIPTIELQHGAMGKSHVAYNCLCRNVSGFPQYIFLFSNFWKDITTLPYDDEHICVTGSTNLELMLKKYANSELKKNSILFIAQNNPQLFDWALNLCKILKEKNCTDKKILYKMHPGYEEDYENFCKEGEQYSDILQIVRKEDKNLYECFAESYAQVGVTSTGLFEGLAFGLKSYIVDNQYVDELFQSLIEKGFVKVIHSADEILVDDICTESRVDYLWKENALFNTIKEIRRIAESELSMSNEKLANKSV